MREFSLDEQLIINKILTIPEIHFRQLFTESFLKNSRVEINNGGRIDIYAEDGEQWKASVRELNTVVNLLAYLLNNQLIFAYSTAVIIPGYNATLGEYAGKKTHTVTLPYNKAILARVTLRHQSNLFEPYEPLRILKKNKFILKEDKKHNQIHLATLLAVFVALLAAVAPMLYDRFFKEDEIKILNDRLLRLERQFDNTLHSNPVVQNINNPDSIELKGSKVKNEIISK